MYHVIEDCTDSDFNTKISTDRRNDVLQGVQEMCDKFLKKIYEFLNFQYNRFLESNNNPLEQKKASTLIKAALEMMAIFSQSQGIKAEFAFNKDYDFVVVYLHLLREMNDDIRISAATCLKYLCGRKMETDKFFRLVELFPNFVAEASKASASLPMTDQLPFHILLSEAMSSLITVNIASITNCKQIFSNNVNSPCKELQTLAPYLNLLSDLLNHPSPLVSMSQLNMWIVLLRDPQVSETKRGERNERNEGRRGEQWKY